MRGGAQALRSRAARQPLYLAIHGALRDELHRGRWEIGGSLPSEAELSEGHGVSRITVRHALRLLEAEGYIRKARAKRPLVVATRPAPRAGWLVESIDDIVAMVGDARLAVSSYRRESAAQAGELLGLAEPRLHCLRSVLLRAQKPYARSIIYFPPAIGTRLTRKDFDDTVVFRVLQRELGIRLADVTMTISAEIADEDDRAALACEVGTPLLVMQLLYRDIAGDRVELAFSRSLASEVRLSTRLAMAARQT